jgi:hypothetical protein
MHGLLSRLAKIDSSAERALRIIEFFDQLVVHGADLEAVTRATAVLAEMTAGAVLDDRGRICVVAPDGRVMPPAAPGPQAMLREIDIDGTTIGRVWLEPDGRDRSTHEWDELITDRMAICLATLQARRLAVAPPATLGLTDPAVLHVLLRRDESETETARAARLLGFQVGQQVQVLAVTGDRTGDRRLAALRSEITDRTGGRTVAAALSTTLGVVIAAGRGLAPVPAAAGFAVCVGPPVPVEHSARSWSRARRGVRFAQLGGRWPAWTTVDDLGCLLALGDLDPAEVARDPDVEAVARLAAGRTGETDLAILDGIGALPSVREAAAALHMHHSSVGYRIEAIAKVLGFEVRRGPGRYRARTALLLWQLHVAGSAPEA